MFKWSSRKPGSTNFECLKKHQNCIPYHVIHGMDESCKEHRSNYVTKPMKEKERKGDEAHKLFLSKLTKPCPAGLWTILGVDYYAIRSKSKVRLGRQSIASRITAQTTRHVELEIEIDRYLAFLKHRLPGILRFPKPYVPVSSLYANVWKAMHQYENSRALPRSVATCGAFSVVVNEAERKATRKLVMLKDARVS